METRLHHKSSKYSIDKYTRVPPLAKADITDDTGGIVIGIVPPPVGTIGDFFPLVGVGVVPPPVPLAIAAESKN
jgi:hypothetical protein